MKELDILEVAAPAAPSLSIPQGSFTSRVVLRHLRSPAEIARVVHLREEIDLSVHAASGLQQFQALEKKETSAAWSSASTSMAKPSAPSGSCRWGTA
jgi:hypothetical protein